MKITVADYLAKRLELLGIKDVFGLPGDYNFNILDAIEGNKNLNWINCTNELNAGYAADGYSRINGYGAIVTTYGVGELSAINAIAGAYAENVPVIQITGLPSSYLIKKNAIIHHNFQKPDYYAYMRAYSNVVETTAYLNDENTKYEIDRIFETIIKTKRPVYIALPADICFKEIDDNIPEIILKSEKRTLNSAAQHIKTLIDKANKPLFLFDYLIKRHKCEKNLENLVNKIKIPFSTMLMGKSALNETNPYFIGVNMGGINGEEFLKTYNNFDLIISFGVLYSDLNTANFSVRIDDRCKINIQSDHVEIEGIKYQNVLLGDLVEKLTEILNPKNQTVDFKIKGYDEINETKEPIKVDDIFPLIQKFLNPNDIFIVETGIAGLSAGLIKLPENVKYLSQTLWGSIGWATPALFGAAMADRSRRPILLTGEGSHQLTVQEIANMFKYNIKPIIILLNNGGYTIERMLSPNPNSEYNNITVWNYEKLSAVFSPVFDKDSSIKTVKNPFELKEALEEAQIAQEEKFCYIQIYTDKFDIPKNSSWAAENEKKCKEMPA